MLFNSHIFIFVFLPITVFLYYRIASSGFHQAAITWLVGASFFFYGWWNPVYLSLLLFSIFINYGLGLVLYKRFQRKLSRSFVLTLGIAVNLGLLGYFKYTNFFVDNFNALFSTSYHVDTIFLPLAISFFTFQQITYIIDASQGETREYRFLHYCLFVTFFPQLIAGPIVHHREMLPQFANRDTYHPNYTNLSIGLSIFAIGLIKKVVLADSIAGSSTPVFNATMLGYQPDLLTSWLAALSYTFQLYFDFSGYSDMAIGLARMFGIKLPLNFASPYKAGNIIEFWRHWHMTLSRFLRDYLYIPLGGNRKGRLRRYINMLVTMLLGGLWHGASWNFVIWGGLHGLYLVVNHGWHHILGKGKNKTVSHGIFYRGTARIITFLAVVLAWVLFRAENLDSAMNIYSGMFGLNEAAQNVMPMEYDHEKTAIHILVLLMISQFLPNTQEIMRRYHPALISEKLRSLPELLTWRPNVVWALVLGSGFAYAILKLVELSEFLYFQF